MNPSQEPAVNTGPVRRFKNPDYREVASTLGDLRHKIDALDAQIVALLAQRALCVKDATRFKRDAFQVAAPARQAEVFQRIRDLCAPHAESFPEFADVVEASYRTLVAGFIAAENKLFDSTTEI
jgi:isochorismate pyruvate lyase